LDRVSKRLPVAPRLPTAFVFLQGYEMYSKNDQQFARAVFRALRDEFSCQPSLNVQQFLSGNFAERKIIFTCQAIQRVRSKHAELHREKLVQQNRRLPR
jgi:hypothetical protein